VQRCHAVSGSAAIGAPLFAVWVVFDYRRVLRGTPDDDPMAARLGGFDATELRREFLSQGAFVILPDFLPLS